MYQYLKSHKVITLLTALSLGILIVSLIIKPINAVPLVVSSNPTPNATKVDFSNPVSFILNRDIDSTQISLTSVPEESWSLKDNSDKIITFVPSQYLRINKEYVLSLSYSGKIIYTLGFTTIDQQSEPRYIQEVNNEVKRDYPLAIKTPYEQSGFSVVYSAPLTLEITLKNPNLTSQEVIDEVKAWVKSNGGDVGAHKYIIASQAN